VSGPDRPLGLSRRTGNVIKMFEAFAGVFAHMGWRSDGFSWSN
jgi:hypothetical protein